MKNILNNEYSDLNDLFKNNSDKYLENKPFPHIVFDNFFNNEIIEDILSDFPKNLKNIGVKYDNAQEKKIASDSAATISSKTNHLISFLNSYNFKFSK